MHEHMLAMQAALGRGAASPEGMLEGVVVTGSWNPAEGTIEVQIGDTATVFTDLGDGPVVVQATMLTPALGEQYGPLGGERALLFRTQSGYSALVEHGPDDTPKAPAGEIWFVRYDPKKMAQSPPVFSIVSFDKMTTDGKTTGDGKGGRRIIVGGYCTIATTNGATVTLDDTGKQLTLTTPGGQSLILDDTTGSIQLQGSGDPVADGIVRQSDLVNLLSQIQTNLQTFFTAHVSTGSGNPGPTTLTSITPTASSKSFTA